MSLTRHHLATAGKGRRASELINYFAYHEGMFTNPTSGERSSFDSSDSQTTTSSSNSPTSPFSSQDYLSACEYGNCPPVGLERDEFIKKKTLAKMSTKAGRVHGFDSIPLSPKNALDPLGKRIFSAISCEAKGNGPPWLVSCIAAAKKGTGK